MHALLRHFQAPQRRSFVHSQMIGDIALDNILRVFARGMTDIALEHDLRSDLLGDDSAGCIAMVSELDVVSHSEFGSHSGVPHLTVADRCLGGSTVPLYRPT